MDCIYNLPHGEGNPRNSEGSFVKLNDGSIMFAYTRYRGNSWDDHATADIVAIKSADGGRTWSDYSILQPNRAANVMSVSLLRLQDGRIMFMFLEKTDRRDLLPSLEMFGPVLVGRIDDEDKDNIIFSIRIPDMDGGLQDVFNECLSETVGRVCDIICFTDKTIKLDGSDIYFHDGLKLCGANSNMIVSVDGKEMRYNPY